MNATRQAYLPGRRARPSMEPSRGAAKPKEKPLPRKPPPKRPPDRRKPGRKDPKRPRRKEPQPRKPKELPRKPTPRNPKLPLFPPVKKPDTPFGKRKVFPKFRKWPRIPLINPARFFPWIAAAELGYLWYYGPEERADPAAAGFQQICKVDFPPYDTVSHNYYPAGNVCGVGMQPVDHDGPSPGEFVIPGGGWDSGAHFETLYYSWKNPFVDGRGTHVEVWQRDNWHHGDGSPTVPDEFPETYPEKPLLPWVYYPYPEPDHPLDWPLPDRPLPLPRGRPDPRHPEDPLPDSYFPTEPLTPGPDVPAIELTPGDLPVVVDHEKRPPDDKEKEKKKKLEFKVGQKWLKFLVGLAGKYTELDDFMAALYKGLNWKVRRWRGRDGVWRDRDITSWDRAERIYNQLGDLNIAEAMNAIREDSNTDFTIGKMSKHTQERLERSGLHYPHGLTSGKYSKTWEEVYEKLKVEQAKRIGHRYIYTNDYDPVTKTWTRNKRLRTDKTTIPWFKQTSDWKRRAYRGESEYWELPANRKQDKVVSRNYYQSRHTWRPWDLRKGKKL